MSISESFTYDATFSDNILVVGQTGCGNTSFVQGLGKNKIVGDGLLNADWLSKINLTKAREDQIRKCFEYRNIEFHYPNNTDELEWIIETFQKDSLDQDKEETNNNFDCYYFEENEKSDKLSVMNDVSSLADKSNDFSNFLTVSRKFGYICLYIFHIVYPTKSIRQMTKIFNIFTSFGQLGNILKMFTKVVTETWSAIFPLVISGWTSFTYHFWMNQNGCAWPWAAEAKYRTNADNNFEQYFYFYQNEKATGYLTNF